MQTDVDEAPCGECYRLVARQKVNCPLRMKNPSRKVWRCGGGTPSGDGIPREGISIIRVFACSHVPDWVSIADGRSPDRQKGPWQHMLSWSVLRSIQASTVQTFSWT